jgi:hypothetical protein
MNVIATLRDGSRHRIPYDSVEDFIDTVTGEALTGSGAPLEGLTITSTDGASFLYADVATYAEEADAAEGET